MIYGLIFLGHQKLTEQDQRTGILQFAEHHNLNLDEFVSFNANPNILMFHPGDTIICYAWSCLCQKMSFLRAFVQHIVKNGVSLYSVTSKYHIDTSMDMNALRYAIGAYEDIRVNFWSNKSVEGAAKRVNSGRRLGYKNKTHILDGKEKSIWDMYNNGFSLCAIAKKMKVSAPTIKRFLSTQN